MEILISAPVCRATDESLNAPLAPLMYSLTNDCPPSTTAEQG